MNHFGVSIVVAGEPAAWPSKVFWDRKATSAPCPFAPHLIKGLATDVDRGKLAMDRGGLGRGFLGGLFESERSYQPVLPVTVTHQDPNGSVDGREGTLYCKPTMTATDRMGQVGGMATRLLFSFSPF